MKLKKSQARRSYPKGKRQTFVDSLDDLWDIASYGAIKTIRSDRFLSKEKKKEDIASSEDQKGKRLASMIGKDKMLHINQFLQRRTRMQHQVTQ